VEAAAVAVIDSINTLLGGWPAVGLMRQPPRCGMIYETRCEMGL